MNPVLRNLPLALACLILTWFAIGDIHSRDVFWHLRTGLDLLESAINPFYDSYSIGFRGEPILFQPVMFQTLVAAFYKAGGLFPGLQIVKAFLWLFPLGMLIYTFRKRRVSFEIEILVLALAVSLIPLNYALRPELLSYSFEIVLVMLCFLSRAPYSVANFTAVGVLTFFWVNSHSSSAIGFPILFGYFVNALYFNRNRFVLVGFLGISFFLLGYVNPSFKHPFLELVFQDHSFFDFIYENQARPIGSHPFSVYMLWALVLLTSFMMVQRRRIGECVLLVGLLVASTQMSKLIPHLAVISLPLISLVDFEKTVRTKIHRMLYLFSVVVLLMFPGFLLLKRGLHVGTHLSPFVYPIEAARVLKEDSRRIHILNDYNAGGYLLYAVPDIKVALDGRGKTLYPVRHFEHIREIGLNVNKFHREVNREKIYFVLGHHRSSKPLIDRAEESDVFKKVSENRGWVLYKRWEPRDNE